MENYTAKPALNTLKIIHLALMISPIFLALVAIIVSDKAEPIEGIEILMAVPALLLLTAFPVSAMLFKQTMKTLLGDKTDLRSRMAAYQSAHLIRMSLFEAPALFAGVVTLISGNVYVLGVVAVVIVVFITKMPTVFLLENEIGLTPAEKASLM